MSTFEIVRGVEGDCLVLDGTRICGPRPWGGGRIINTFRTDGVYEVIDKDEYRRLMADNAKLREQVDAAHMSRLLTENENESLRELVAKYSAAAKYLCGFSHCNECNLDCASVFGDVPSGWDCARMLLDKKARELEVEVD